MGKTKSKKKPSLGDDLKVIKLPFSLFAGFSAVVEELEDKEFSYAGIHPIDESTFVFRSEERSEFITIYVSENNLLIKQFLETPEEEKDKLKVIYVVKDSERTFKIV